MITKEKIEELEKMRVKITKIYMEFGNLKDCPADMIMMEDIQRFRKRIALKK